MKFRNKLGVIRNKRVIFGMSKINAMKTPNKNMFKDYLRGVKSNMSGCL